MKLYLLLLKNMLPKMDKLILAVILSFQTMQLVKGSCYFQQEFQGDYVMQTSSAIPGSGIQYTTLNITENSISIWGTCHRRIGSNFILIVNFSETSCMRCLNLKLRSPSVLQVISSSQETISKCFTNEESAETNCPSKESLSNHELAEILLFKTKNAQGSFAPKQYCPFDRKYNLNYQSKDLKCNGHSSSVDSCPSGSTLNFRLRGCNPENMKDLMFHCLGQWGAHNGENYLIVMDSRYQNNQKYRCALYKEDPRSGKVTMALSSDSSCTTGLYNSTSGYETITLTPKPENPWPLEVSSGICSFPKWINGDWEYVKVHGDTMIYRDHSSFKTYTIKCMGIMEDRNKYLIFSRSQCDEETNNCMIISNRSDNIFEFQIGNSSTSSDNTDYFGLCSAENFDENSWITQGRSSVIPSGHTGLCPITGNYSGIIPDATELCAMLWSDCRAPDLMYYQVSHCETQEIYEEREYQCLGHWSESNLLYTYTERRDVAPGTYECFVGSIITDNDIYIKEAGEHCQSNIDPLRHGMKLKKTQPLYTCVEKNTNTRESFRPTVPSVHTTRRTTLSSIETSNISEESREKKTSIASITQLNFYFYAIIVILSICCR